MQINDGSTSKSFIRNSSSENSSCYQRSYFGHCPFLYLSFDKNYRDQGCLKYRNESIVGKKGPKTKSSHRDSNPGTLVRDAPYSQRRPKIKKVK